MKRARRIHVTIDRLVLHGIDPAGRAQFIDALRSELSHRFSAQDRPGEQGGNAPANGPSPTAGAASLGAQCAARIAERLGD